MKLSDGDKLVIQQARANLIDFEIATNPNYIPNWHHRLVARELEHIEAFGDRDYKILIVVQPPRSGKSQQISIDFPAWFLGRNPEKEIITASYSAELAQDFGGKTREKVDSEQYKLIFPEVKLKEDEKARGHWRTKQGGSYMAVGVGGPITGRGADVFCIDDAIKNREEAESEVYRYKIWSWFTSCFVKGTPVLMANGEWQPIEKITEGQEVMSFDGKRMVKSRVRATGEQLPAQTYELETEYGNVVCTGEHPFFSITRRNKYLGLKYGKWVKAKDLKRGDRVVMSLHGATGGKKTRFNGSRSYIPRDFWWLSGFILGDGFISQNKFGIAMGEDEKLNNYVEKLCIKFFGKAKRMIRKPRTDALMVYSTKAVEQLLKIGLTFNKAKEKFVPSEIFRLSISHRRAFLSGFLAADGHRCSKDRWEVGLAGEKCVDDIRLLAMSCGFICGKKRERRFTVQPPGSPVPIEAVVYRLHIRDRRRGFYSCRVRSVNERKVEKTYNLEVEKTGTFVANGFVVHNTAFTRLSPQAVMVVLNTRWHTDDLTGRILANEDLRKRTKLIRLPAIAEEDEPNRQKGEALWPERYSLEALEEIKKTIGIYDFSALYQGSPVLSERQEFRPDWIKKITEEEVEKMNCRRFLTVDTAMSKKATANYTGFCDNRVNMQNFWHLKAWRVRLSPEELVDNLFSLHERFKYEKIGLEKTTFTEGLKPYLDEEQRKRGRFLPIVELEHKQANKEVRIRGLIPRYSSGSIYHIDKECASLEEEMYNFPVGANDDTLDALAYMPQIVDYEDERELALQNWRIRKPKVNPGL